MADKNKENVDIPLKRPKGVNETQWKKATDIYNAAVRAGDPAPELTLAQAALETGWFKKTSGKYNYFGQKATNRQAGSNIKTTEYDEKGKKKITDRFRDYQDLEEALADRNRLWGSKYKDAETYQDALYKIWQYDEEKNAGTGYATDPNYDDKIFTILGMMGVDPSSNIHKQVSVNPQVIDENPNLTPEQKEALKEKNAVQGLTKQEAAEVNAGNVPETIIPSQDQAVQRDVQSAVPTEPVVQPEPTSTQTGSLGYTGQLDMSLLGSKKKSQVSKNAEPVENTSEIDKTRTNALGYTGDINAFPADFKLLNQEFNNGGMITEYNGGGEHEENPNGGIPVGRNSKGGFNLVEEGETRYNDYIFSKEFKLSKDDANRFNINPKYIGKNFADISKDINKQAELRPYDRITKRTTDGNLNKLMMAHEEAKAAHELAQDPSGFHTMPDGTRMPNSAHFKYGGKMYNEGGEVDPPVEGPTKPNTVSVTKKNRLDVATGQYNPKTGLFQENIMNIPDYPTNVPYTSAAAEAARNTTGTPKEFYDWYNNPETKKRLLDQTGYNEKQLDNMITHALKAKKTNRKMVDGAEGQHWMDTNEINYVPGKEEKYFHELVHASGLDQQLGTQLLDILGNPFQQDSKNSFGRNKRYMTQAHEAYGNFAEFRKLLGVQPGQDITKDELQKLVKEKKLENNNFYHTFDDDKIVKAINTIATVNTDDMNTYAKMGGKLNKKYNKGSLLDMLSPQGVQQLPGAELGANAMTAQDLPMQDMTAGAGAGVSATGVAGAAGTALNLANTAFGPTGIETDGSVRPDAVSKGDVAMSAVGGAAQGAMTGAKVGGPIGAAIGGVVGGAAGFFGGKKKQKDANEGIMNNDYAQSAKYTNTFNDGGSLNPPGNKSLLRRFMDSMGQGFTPVDTTNVGFQGGFGGGGFGGGGASSQFRVNQIDNSELEPSGLIPMATTGPTASMPRFTTKASTLDPRGVKSGTMIMPRGTTLNGINTPPVAGANAINEAGLVQPQATANAFMGEEQVQDFTGELPKEPNGPGTTPLSLLRYAPSVGNLLRYMNAPDAAETSFDRLDARYDPQYIDEQTASNAARQSGANTRRSLFEASGGDQSALRASLLASQINEQRGVSDAMFQAQQANNQQDQIAQQFNLNVDQANQQIDMQETIANEQNQAAADAYKQSLLNSTLNDLGAIGREQQLANMLQNVSGGYTTSGQKRKGTLSQMLGEQGTNIEDLFKQLFNGN